MRIFVAGIEIACGVASYQESSFKVKHFGDKSVKVPDLPEPDNLTPHNVPLLLGAFLNAFYLPLPALLLNGVSCQFQQLSCFVGRIWMIRIDSETVLSHAMLSLVFSDCNDISLFNRGIAQLTIENNRKAQTAIFILRAS